jgi:glycosyltransferase involved in cell wall biosynthesis
MAPPILFVSAWLHDGGIERNLAIKAPWFAARGHRVAVAAWHMSPTLAGQPNPVVETLRAARVPIYALGGDARRYELAHRAVHLAALIARTRSHVVVGHELQANVVTVLASLLLARVPRVILELHNTPPRDIADARRARVGWLYRRANGIVAVSDNLREEAIARFRLPAERVVTIHNPFDLREIRRLSAAPLPPGAPAGPYVVACGRFVEDKAFGDLLSGFATVARERPVILVLIGDGPLRESLVRTAQALGVGGRVLFPGFVANPFPWFANAAAFVCPSHTESFSRVVVEAMACGVPVIASRCEGPREILAEGAFGRLFEVGASEQLARALRDVLDGATGAVEAAQRHAEEFSQARILPRLAAYYSGDAVLDGRDHDVPLGHGRRASELSRHR